MRNLGLDAVVKDPSKRITFFAPTNDAFAIMRQTQRGQTLLDPRERDILRNVRVTILHRNTVLKDQTKAATVNRFARSLELHGQNFM